MPDLTAADIMNPTVYSVHEDDTVEAVRRLFLDRGVSGAPVVDSCENVTGVVTLTDLLRTSINTKGHRGRGRGYYTDGWGEPLTQDEIQALNVTCEDSLTVSEIMNPVVFNVDRSTTVAELARTMLSAHIHRVIVTEDDHVVGMVTTMDMLKVVERWYSKQAEANQP